MNSPQRSVCLEKGSNDGGGDDGDGGDEEERDELEDVEVRLGQFGKFRHVFRRRLCSGRVWRRSSIKIWRSRGSIEVVLLVMRMLNYRCSRL